jgi:serine/threonine protein kinase
MAAPLGRAGSVHRARASVYAASTSAAAGGGGGGGGGGAPAGGPAPAPGGAPPEQPLANYLLGREIGRGAFGVVFEALDRRTGSRVAVKRLPLYNVAAEDLPQIQAEIDLLKRLDHPNIVRLIDSARSRDYLYIVLELVEAGSLLQAIQRFGPLPEQLAAVYVAQVLRGLAFLSVQGVVHRDLKVRVCDGCRGGSGRQHAGGRASLPRPSVRVQLPESRRQHPLTLVPAPLTLTPCPHPFPPCRLPTC